MLYLLISLVNWIFFFQELLRNIIIMYSVVDFFNFLVRVEERGGGRKERGEVPIKSSVLKVGAQWVGPSSFPARRPSNRNNGRRDVADFC